MAKGGEECRKCYGTGTVVVNNEEKECPRCNGTGEVPSGTQ